MSEQERLVAIGRMVEENREIRSHLATLIADGQRVGRILAAVGKYLAPNDEHIRASLKDGGQAPELSDFPSSDDLRKLIAEVHEAQRRKRELQHSLKEFGFDLKD